MINAYDQVKNAEKSHLESMTFLNEHIESLKEHSFEDVQVTFFNRFNILLKELDKELNGQESQYKEFISQLLVTNANERNSSISDNKVLAAIMVHTLDCLEEFYKKIHNQPNVATQLCKELTVWGNKPLQKLTFMERVKDLTFTQYSTKESLTKGVVTVVSFLTEYFDNKIDAVKNYEATNETTVKNTLKM